MKDLRGAIVERIEHPKTKREGLIRLDKRSMTFFARANEAEPLGPEFKSKDGREVRAWLLQQLARTSEADNLQWLPVIEIEQGGEHRMRYRDESQVYGESMNVEITRYYIALTHDQQEWRRLKWEECEPTSATVIPDPDRYAASSRYSHGPKAEKVRLMGDKPFRLPSFKEGYRGSKSVQPYTAELWQGLKLIVETIGASRKRLGELVNTKDGIETVAAVGAGKQPLLLTAGKR